jgi:hypothetical protein
MLDLRPGLGGDRLEVHDVVRVVASPSRRSVLIASRLASPSPKHVPAPAGRWPDAGPSRRRLPFPVRGRTVKNGFDADAAGGYDAISQVVAAEMSEDQPAGRDSHQDGDPGSPTLPDPGQADRIADVAILPRGRQGSSR